MDVSTGRCTREMLARCRHEDAEDIDRKTLNAVVEHMVAFSASGEDVKDVGIEDSNIDLGMSWTSEDGSS